MTGEKIFKPCRLCANDGLFLIMSFGKTPLADRLLSADELGQKEPEAPLELAFCPRCYLVQITETVSPEILFAQRYPYFSSSSESYLAHSRKNATEIMASRKLHAKSLALEIASNDGYMLKNFRERGIPVMGIDPAKPPAMAAMKAGIPTHNVFFDKRFARRLAKEGSLADVVIANNVLAHVADLNGFVEGISVVLKDEGMAVIEVPYLADMIEGCEFDTVYHQHLCYFSATALDRLFRAHSLFLSHIKRIPVHGGSVRLYVEPRENPDDSVISMLEREDSLGIHDMDFYRSFAARARSLRKDLVDMLRGLKNKGKKIVGYGAAAKAATLLSYCGIGQNFLEYIVDAQPFKHGLYMGGNHLPVFSTRRLMEDMPDYVLLLAWNLADEILAQQEPYRRSGGRFIIPIPELRVI
ncbi:Methyltransferase [Candidatus Desulfarcum epimagneticum]|uniref:Methyltransferase n=1 Tax=uncultured Desulfobacteraceae bacterium TaxID=218296 RepID=A0A484HLB9_9BACT|nr:Methyltransferase [uncultured Desulfobacteraceae bacterium]